MLLALANPEVSEVYVLASGGVGDEERARMESQVSRYSVRMRMTGQSKSSRKPAPPTPT